MRRSRDSGGFSIIEVVFVIVIIGVFFSGLAVVLSNTTMGNMDLDFGTTAVFLARETMAETKAKSFAGIVDVATTKYCVDPLACDEDDPFRGYSYQVDVYCTDTADLDVEPAGCDTDYKGIIVTVTRTDWAGSVVLTNLKTDIE